MPPKRPLGRYLIGLHGSGPAVKPKTKIITVGGKTQASDYAQAWLRASRIIYAGVSPYTRWTVSARTGPGLEWEVVAAGGSE